LPKHLNVAVQVFLFVLNDLFSNLSQVANNTIFFHLLTITMNTDVATVLENLARLLRNTAREAEAQELEERAKSIRNGKKKL